MECRICGDQSSRPVGREVAESTVYRCGTCRFLFCSPLPRQESESAGQHSILTAEWYSEGLLHSTDLKRARYELLASGRHRMYCGTLARSNFRLLEIGCGTAGLAAPFGSLGVDYEGIDIDPRMIRYAADAGANVRLVDAMDLNVRERYDVICFHQLLEHMTHPVAFIAKVREMLVPGGVLHCDVPNDGSLASRLYAALPLRPQRYGAIEHPHHAFAYTRTALECLLSGGFRARVFSAAVDDPVWGQAGCWGAAQRALLRVSAAFGAGSLLVAYAVKQ